MFEYLKNMFRKKEVPLSEPGLHLPSKDELAEMPALEEIVATIAPVTWGPLDINKVHVFPSTNQNGSGSCVAFTISLLSTIMYYLRTGIHVMFSPAWVYQQRVNKGTAGMVGTDSFKIAAKGMLPEVLMPSQSLTEKQINSVKVEPWFEDIAKVFSFSDSFVQLPLGDIDTLASTLSATGKPVMVWFQFYRKEWTSVPEVINMSGNFVRHSVTVLPNSFGIHKGKKAFVIQDSWGQNSTKFGGRRIITEDFFKAKNIFVAYPKKFKFEKNLPSNPDVVVSNKPKFVGTIISAQKCLRYEGFFPINVDYYENVGPVTRKALIGFQTKYRLPKTAIIDSQTAGKLSELYPR